MDATVQAPSPPAVITEPFGAYTLARIADDITSITYQDVDDALTAALAMTRTALIVDMAQVGDCGSDGLKILARLNLRAVGRGVSIVLTGVHGRVAHLLGATSPSRGIPIRMDPSSAARWLDQGTAALDDPYLTP